MRNIFFIFLFILFFIFSAIPVSADELGDIEHKLSDLKHALKLSVDATTPLEKDLTQIQKNLDAILMQIRNVESQVVARQKEVDEGESLLVVAEELLNQKVRGMYKSSTMIASSGLLFLLQKDIERTVQKIGYQKAVLTNDRDTIIKIVMYIKDLEEKKKLLEEQKIRLAAIKKESDEQAKFLAEEIGKAKKYQSVLSNSIATLTARQQQLIAEKLSSLNLPVSLGSGPLYCTDDRKIDPGFHPAFAFFTYGIPHRVGLNQYGALGRANAGQSYQDILRAYFDGISFERRDTNMKIKVQGYGEKSLDEYMLGIYEMPGDWPLEALKAQVVAARSYALAYTNNGTNEICTSQACQVYKGGNKGGNWEKAVKDTAGEVLVRDGAVIKAWYASTFGGYAFTSSDVWGSSRSYTKRLRDTNGDIGSFEDLYTKAYDKDSPCFYAAQGFRSEYGKSAWLKEEEVADIVNTILLAKRDSSIQNHLYQPDKSNPEGTDTWDRGRVRQELENRGGSAFTSISNVSIDWDKGSGQVSSISFSGNAGNTSFNGSEFRNYFNVRAPANIQIVGPLYNIERK